MLIKYTVITTKSLVLVKSTITKHDGSLKSFLASKMEIAKWKLVCKRAHVRVS